MLVIAKAIANEGTRLIVLGERGTLAGWRAGRPVQGPTPERSMADGEERARSGLDAVLAGTPYRAVARLGQGGMGEVFEALHVPALLWFAVRHAESKG